MSIARRAALRLQGLQGVRCLSTSAVARQHGAAAEPETKQMNLYTAVNDALHVAMEENPK